MKKIIALLLCFVLLLTSTACGTNNGGKEKLMKLYLYGNMDEMHEKKDVRAIEAKFTLNDQVVKTYATIKLQGTSSLAYEKKNFTIKFYEDPEHEVSNAIDVGWGAQSEYCLKANWIDKTHSRNLVTAKLAAEIQSKYGVMEEAPRNGLVDGFPIEVYINNRYHGLYTWNIPKGAWQFGMDEENPDHIVLCGENWKDPVYFTEEPNFEVWEVEVGPENEETLAKFARVSSFIRESTDEEFRESFEEYIDLDAMLTYFIMVDFAYLPDNFGKNMLFVTYDGDVWYPSLYDLDTSWGADYTGRKLWGYQNGPLSFGTGASLLGRRFQTLFAQELHDRYFELREDILTKEHVMELFNAFADSIPEAAFEREKRQWSGVDGENIPGYDYSQIEEYLDSVIDRLDERYSSLAS